MGKLDIKDREFFSDCGRFAEFFNVNIYHGAKVLVPENLVLLNREYLSGTNSAKFSERDVLMKDKARGVIYGLEVETESDYSMPERVMMYDACEYSRQIREIHNRHKDRGDYRSYRERKSRMKKNDFLLPTLTAVLFLGEGHWKGKQTLSQMLRVPPPVNGLPEPEFCDYDFPLIEADFVNPDNYRTDLKEFFQAMQCRRDRAALKNLFGTEGFSRLASETEEMIAAHLNIKRLTYKMEKEGLPMCKAFNDLMKEQRRDGIKEGRKEGKREGIKEGKREGIKEGKREGIKEGKREGKREGKKEGKREEKMQIVRRMLKEGMDEALIMRMTRCSREELGIVMGR